MEKPSRARSAVIAVAGAVVVLGSLAKTGLSVWKHARTETPILEIYREGTARRFPVVEGGGKKASTADKPFLEMKDFDEVVMQPISVQLDPNKEPSTFHAVLLRPRPEAATRVDAHAKDLVHMIRRLVMARQAATRFRSKT